MTENKNFLKNIFEEQLFRLSFQVFFLITSIVGFVFIYWIPPINLYGVLRDCLNLLEGGVLSEQQFEFYLEQYRVGTNEIANNNLKIDGWFYSKYMIIGGFLAALLYYLFYNLNKSGEQTEPKDLINKSLSKPSMCLIVSIAFVLCLSIDIQIKDRSIGGIQRGIWIKYFIEKPMQKYSIVNEENDTISYNSKIVGWESFYHNEKLFALKEIVISNDSTIYNNICDNNENRLFLISKFSPRYFLTYLIYVFYILIMFQNFKCEEHKFREPFIIITFIIVHIGIIIASYILHTLPNTLEYTECVFGDFNNKEFFNSIKIVRDQSVILAIALLVWNFIGFRLIDNYTEYEKIDEPNSSKNCYLK